MKTVLDAHAAAYTGNTLYDYDNEIMLNWYPKRVIELSREARSLLELGLGHGITARLFSTNFPRHVILEGSPEVIKNFRNKFPDCPAEIIETYFEKFESDERFDLIVMGFILEHVDNPVEIISRYRRFLTPRGKMFLTVPNAESLHRRLGYHAGLLDDMQRLSAYDLQLGHKRYYTVKSLLADIEQGGCNLERLEGIYLKPFTTNQIISLNLDKSVIDALCIEGINYPELSCALLAQVSGCDR